MANLRFPKVFVLTNVGTKFITTNTVKPNQLTADQVGFHTVDQFEVVGVGTGATPGATLTALQIHQNVGDNKFGTVRTKTINRDQVKAYYKQAASVPVTEVWYIGYDEVDNTKDIAAPCSKTLVFNIHIYEKSLAKWYSSNPGYNKTIIAATSACTAAAPDAIGDRDTIANAIVAAINNTAVSPFPDYTGSNELPNYVLATKVTTGTVGQADYRVGVKIETLALSPDLLNSCDPIKFYEAKLVTFDVMYNKHPHVNEDLAAQASFDVPITKFRGATSGGGFPAELAALEAESQGYDRVREVFENPRYMKTNHKIYAVDGAKYDYIYLQYEWSHRLGGRGSSMDQITEPYEVIIAAPTTTLQPVADVLNSWLTGKFAALTI
jgi:hypothetical protein